MALKNLFLILITSTVLTNQAFAEDYSKKNPFGNKYVYKNELQWQEESQPLKTNPNNIDNNRIDRSYFNSSLANPLSLSRSNSSGGSHSCWDKAALSYNLDPWLLFAIAKVESSFNHKAINKNVSKSGVVTYDLGLMQINSIWLPSLRNFGIDTKDLFEPCTSIFVGAWIVAQNIKRFGYNQDGIGAYNAPNNISLRRAYAKKVYAAYADLTKKYIK